MNVGGNAALYGAPGGFDAAGGDAGQGGTGAGMALYGAPGGFDASGGSGGN
jgi:hypothetical protein